MKKIIISIYILSLIVMPSVLKAQDVHFSQFYESSILRNPSLTGIFTGDYKVGVVYRDQWSSISNPFRTALISAEARIPINDEINDFFSVGLLGYYDKAGSIDMQTTAVYPAINYNKSLDDAHGSFLSVGFTGGYIQRSFDPSKATFDNQYQNGRFNAANATGEILPNPTFTQWDLGAGISMNSNLGQNNEISYIVGVAGYHFTQPNSSFYRNSGVNTDIRWNVNAGMTAKVNETISYQLFGNYMRQGTYNEAIFGGFLVWNKRDVSAEEQIAFALYGGVFYRYADAVIPTLKLRFKGYTLGMSYDVNLSKLKAATNLRGGYEITLFKTGFFKNPNFEKSRTLCPHFY